MWNRITGQRVYNYQYYNKCLKLDNVNDYLSLGNSTFYDVGTGSFTFAVRFMRYADLGTTSTTSQHTLFRNSQTINVNRIVAGLGYVNSAYNFSFTLVTRNAANTADIQDIFKLPISYFPLGQWITLILGRSGDNYGDANSAGWATSVRNPANYFFYVNGVKVTDYTLVQTDPLGLNYQLDNTESFTIGQYNNTIYAPFYYDYFAYYNRALNETEIAQAQLNNFTDDGAKGIWNFTGNTNDDSSVQNPMQLINSTTEDFITWPKSFGVLVFQPGIANQVFSLYFVDGVTLTGFYKNHAYSYGYNFDNGSTWTSIGGGSGGTNQAINIAIPAGTTLYIRDATSRTVISLIHLQF